MAWPDDESLPVGVHAAFGADLAAHPATWLWTSLTDRWRENPTPIAIRRGAGDGAPEVSAGTCSVELGNDDGALTPLNPASAFWPYVDLNTPIMVDVQRPNPVSDGDSFSTNSTNSWGVSGGGRTWTTISGGAPVSASDYQVAGGVGTHSVPLANGYRATWIAVNVTDADVTATVVCNVTPAGAPIEPGNLMLRVQDLSRYYQARLSVAPDGTITASLHASGATGELVTATVPGLTWTAGTAYRIRAQAWGTWLRMRVWRAADPEPETWTLTATATDYPNPGGVGVRTGVAFGNTNTKPVICSYDDFTVTELTAIRMDGFADSWEPAFTPTGNDIRSTVNVTASGLLRRLGQGKAGALSAPYRLISGSNPAAWWPLNDGSDAVRGESGLTGGTPIVPENGLAVFGGDIGVTWLDRAVGAKDGSLALRGPVSMPNTGTWTFDLVFRVGADVLSTTKLYGDGPALDGSPRIDWSVDINGIAGFIQLNRWVEEHSTSSVTAVATISTTVDDERAHHLRVTIADVGGSVNWSVAVDGGLIGGGSTVDLWQPITRLRLTSSGPSDQPAQFEHVTLWAGSAPSVSSAVKGYAGEKASDRIARLCAEDGIPLLVDAGESERLGPQPIANIVDLLRDAERADMGVLSEHMWGLKYRPRSAHYNQDPALTVDLATYKRSGDTDRATVLKPIYDDQRVRNDWTVSRPDGATIQVVDQAHIDRYGRYDDSTQVNVSTDLVLVDHASWRVHQGTWQEMRYPAMSVDLLANPDLVGAWLGLTVGDRVTRINPPAPHPPGTIDQLALGYTEILGVRSWSGQLVCAPYGPFIVGEAEFGRADTDGSVLVNPIVSGTSTAALVAVTAGPQWITTATHPTQFPFNIKTGGVVLEVTGINPAVYDLFARTSSSGWGTAPSGQAWTTSGGSASDYSVASGVGVQSHNSVNVLRRCRIDTGASDFDFTVDVSLSISTPTGAAATAWVCGRYLDDSNHYIAQLSLATTGQMRIQLDKRVTGTLTNIVPAVTLGANTADQWWRVRFRGAGSLITAKAWNLSTQVESTWNVIGVDTSLTTGTQIGLLSRLETGNTNTLPVTFSWDNLTILNRQTFTITQTPVNGVNKTIAAGEPLSLAQPWIAAL